MKTFDIKFDYQAMGDTFLRSDGTRSLVMSSAQGIAARAGHGCRAHLYDSSQNRPMAAVWTRAKTPKQAESAKLALEGAI